MKRNLSFFDGASLCVAFVTVIFLTASLCTIIIGGLPFLPGALRSQEVLFSIRLSLVTSTISTLLCFAVGIPCAYALARCRMPLRNLCRLVLELPLSLPYLVLGLCLLMMFFLRGGKTSQDVRHTGHLRTCGHRHGSVDRQHSLRDTAHAHGA